MAENKVEKRVFEMVLPLTENLGYELVDVEYVKEGPNYFLRIYIDKPEGVSLDDCQIINNIVEPVLDKEDPISAAYFLEICSPGLDRPLKTDRDFEKYNGEEVELNLFAAVDGVKHFEGVLLGKKDGIITIEVENKKEGIKEISFPSEKISIIRRLIKF